MTIEQENQLAAKSVLTPEEIARMNRGEMPAVKQQSETISYQPTKGK